jgi:hypothetical protein
VLSKETALPPRVLSRFHNISRNTMNLNDNFSRIGAFICLLLLSVIISPGGVHGQTNTLQLSNCLGGDALISGEDYEVQWTPIDDSSRVIIKLWDLNTGEWCILDTSSTANSGAFTWHVPTDLSGDFFRLVLEPTNEGTSGSRSLAFFSVSSPSEKTVTPGSSFRNYDIVAPLITFFNDTKLIAWSKPGATSLELRDVLGRPIYSESLVEGSQQSKLPLSLHSGAFFVGVHFADGSVGQTKIISAR